MPLCAHDPRLPLLSESSICDSVSRSLSPRDTRAQCSSALKLLASAYAVRCAPLVSKWQQRPHAMADEDPVTVAADEPTAKGPLQE
jgi:hypothetical protein